MGVNIKATQGYVQFVVVVSRADRGRFSDTRKRYVQLGLLPWQGDRFRRLACSPFSCASAPGAAAGKWRAVSGRSGQFVLTGAAVCGGLVFMDLAFVLPSSLCNAVTLAAYWLALPLTLDAVKML